MEILINYWFVFVGVIVSVVLLLHFSKYPRQDQLNKVREWLIYACVLAEKEIGSGTGQIKLRYVYDLFNQRFKWISRIISFEMFSVLVDEALIVVKHELKSNKNVKNYIEKGIDK